MSYETLYNKFLLTTMYAINSVWYHLWGLTTKCHVA